MYRAHDGGRAVIRLADNATIPHDELNSDWQAYLAWVADGHTPDAEPGPDLEALKQQRLGEINRAYEAEFSAIRGQYPDTERESWPVQLAEAEALADDPQAATPFLDGLILARGLGESRAEMAAKVMSNHTTFVALGASLTGRRHVLRDQVLAAETVEALEAITWV